MKDNKGITLMSLVVTIIILFIMSTLTVRVGIDAYNTIKVQNFISNMKVIQTKVDNIAEETDDVSGYGFLKLSGIASTNSEDYNFFIKLINNPDENNININNSWNSTLDGAIENYYYFSSKDLDEKLGIKNKNLTVVINFKTRNIISKNGVVENGKKYYRQYDLTGGDKLLDRETRILFIYPTGYNANSYVNDLKNSFEKVDSISATEIDYDKVANDFKNHSQDAYDVAIYYGYAWTFDSSMRILYEAGIKTITNGNDSTSSYIISDSFPTSTSYEFNKIVSNKVTDLLNASIQSGNDSQYIIKLRSNWEKWYSATINGNTYDAIGYLKDGNRKWIHVQPIDIINSDILKEMVNFLLYN